MVFVYMPFFTTPALPCRINSLLFLHSSSTSEIWSLYSRDDSDQNASMISFQTNISGNAIPFIEARYTKQRFSDSCSVIVIP